MKLHSMQNNFFVLSALAQELQLILPGAQVISCFSQVKEELVIQFLLQDGKEFYLQAHLQPIFTSLNFPNPFHRAKRNTVDLFPEMVAKKIQCVEVAPFDRLLILVLENGFTVYFKMFASKSNVFLFGPEGMQRMFRNQLKGEADFDPDLFQRPAPDLSFEAFCKVGFHIPTLLPVAVREAESFLMAKGFESADLIKRKELWDACMAYLHQPVFYVGPFEGKIILTVFPFPQAALQTSSALEAFRFFFKSYQGHAYISQMQQLISKTVYKKLEATDHFLHQARGRLSALAEAQPKEQWADILMANLHAIPKGTTEVTLFDFYRNAELNLKIKEGLSPQEQAERWYKKAKNKKQELQRLESGIASREKLRTELLASVAILENQPNRSALLALHKQWIGSAISQVDEQSSFKEEEYMGYTILIGRNAKNNDLLLQNTHKDDLWLHARDVSGSHVVIKRRPGHKDYPKQVVERAAALAAWHSKRKTDTLCPVMVTPRKYVRKIKGAAPGLVRVERETVVMVVPQE